MHARGSAERQAAVHLSKAGPCASPCAGMNRRKVYARGAGDGAGNGPIRPARAAPAGRRWRSLACVAVGLVVGAVLWNAVPDGAAQRLGAASYRAPVPQDGPLSGLRGRAGAAGRQAEAAGHDEARQQATLASGRGTALGGAPTAHQRIDGLSVPNGAKDAAGRAAARHDARGAAGAQEPAQATKPAVDDAADAAAGDGAGLGGSSASAGGPPAALLEARSAETAVPTQVATGSTTPTATAAELPPSEPVPPATATDFGGTKQVETGRVTPPAKDQTMPSGPAGPVPQRAASTENKWGLTLREPDPDGLATIAGGNSAVFVRDSETPPISFTPVLPYPRNPRRRGVRGIVIVGGVRDSGYTPIMKALVKLGAFAGTQQFRGASARLMDAKNLMARLGTGEAMLTLHANDLVLGGLRPRPCHVSRCWWYEARWLLRPFVPPPAGILGRVVTVTDTAQVAFHRIAEAILADLESPAGRTLPNSDGTPAGDAKLVSPSDARPWVLTDARLAFTLGHWIPHMADDDGRLRVTSVVLAVPPTTGVCLMSKAGKMPLEYALAFWEVQTLLSITLTSHMPRIFVDQAAFSSKTSASRVGALKQLVDGLRELDRELGGDGSVGLERAKASKLDALGAELGARSGLCSTASTLARTLGLSEAEFAHYEDLYHAMVDGRAAAWSIEEAASHLSKRTIDYFSECVANNIAETATEYCKPLKSGRTIRTNYNAQPEDKAAQATHVADGYEDVEAVPVEGAAKTTPIFVSDVHLVGRGEGSLGRVTRPLGWIGDWVGGGSATSSSAG